VKRSRGGVPTAQRILPAHNMQDHDTDPRHCTRKKCRTPLGPKDEGKWCAPCRDKEKAKKSRQRAVLRENNGQKPAKDASSAAPPPPQPVLGKRTWSSPASADVGTQAGMPSNEEHDREPSKKRPRVSWLPLYFWEHDG